MSYKTNCGTCGGVIMLLKDSTEGQQVYHGGQCYQKYLEDKDMKYKELEREEIEDLKELKAHDEMNCESCGTHIQRGGRVFRKVIKGSSYDIKFICIGCSQLA